MDPKIPVPNSIPYVFPASFTGDAARSSIGGAGSGQQPEAGTGWTAPVFSAPSPPANGYCLGVRSTACAATTFMTGAGAQITAGSTPTTNVNSPSPFATDDEDASWTKKRAKREQLL